MKTTKRKKPVSDKELRKLVIEFTELWAVWATTPVMTPDEGTIEAAGALCEAVGTKIKDE